MPDNPKEIRYNCKIQFQNYSITLEGMTEKEACKLNSLFKERKVHISRASNATHVINFEHVLFVEFTWGENAQ